MAENMQHQEEAPPKPPEKFVLAGVDLSGIEDCQVSWSNLFILQNVSGEWLLSIGQVRPPIALNEAEARARQGAGPLAAHPIARVVVSGQKLIDLRNLIDRQLGSLPSSANDDDDGEKAGDS